MKDQLALTLKLPDQNILENYYPGKNQHALQQVTQAASGQGEFLTYLWGKSGVGATHLLQGACHYAVQQGLAAMYVNLAHCHHLPVQVLHGLEQLQLLCLDEIQAIHGAPAWQEAIFHLYNRMRAKPNSRLIVAANGPVASLPIPLADLTSRLAWGITYQLLPLSDEEKLAVLQSRAKARGLCLSEDVGNFILRRCVRTMGDLFYILEKLDIASLAAQRRLTVPFVKSILNL